MELAIDTSTDFAGIAITHEGEIITELTWHSGQNHTTELLPNIDRLLKQQKTDIKSITSIFVATGPGSYNGLRVGVSTAKGFSLALNVPIVGISSLEVEAFPFACSRLPICPVHNAGRGEIAVALYRQNRSWECLKEAYITTVEALCGEIKDETIVCGEIPQPVMEQLINTIKQLAIIPDVAVRLRRPGFLGKLGWLRLSAGLSNDPAELQPIYLRQPPITQSKHRIIKK